MKIKINYSCVSHTGFFRKKNQDNLTCMGEYLPAENSGFQKSGEKISTEKAILFGIFDGMGGEECGEIAAHLAAKKASEFIFGKKINQSFDAYCFEANRTICEYAEKNGVRSMGTTAAMLMFKKDKVWLCNIGDSKIFRIPRRGSKHTQISYDHVALSIQGKKPPLLQNLGIPEDELKIKPFHSKLTARNKDRFLICSDGLTDMVSNNDIEKIIIKTKSVAETADQLLNAALENGGKDNISIIICEIEKKLF